MATTTKFLKMAETFLTASQLCLDLHKAVGTQTLADAQSIIDKLASTLAEAYQSVMDVEQPDTQTSKSVENE